MKKLTALAKLHDYVVIALVTEEIVQLHNAWMVQLLVDSDFDLETLLERLAIEARFGNNFAREVVMSLFVVYKLDKRKCPVANNSSDKVRADLWRMDHLKAVHANR